MAPYLYLSWAPDGFDLFLSICLFDAWESTHYPSPNTINQELRLKQFTSFCDIFNQTQKNNMLYEIICETMGIHSQYYYDWNVIYVEGICYVMWCDFILLNEASIRFMQDTES